MHNSALETLGSGRTTIGMRGGAKRGQSVHRLESETLSLKKRSYLTEDHKNVKPVCGPLLRPTTRTRVIKIKCNSFLVTLFL